MHDVKHFFQNRPRLKNALPYIHVNQTNTCIRMSENSWRRLWQSMQSRSCWFIGYWWRWIRITKNVGMWIKHRKRPLRVTMVWYESPSEVAMLTQAPTSPIWLRLSLIKTTAGSSSITMDSSSHQYSETSLRDHSLIKTPGRSIWNIIILLAVVRRELTYMLSLLLSQRTDQSQYLPLVN